MWRPSGFYLVFFARCTQGENKLIILFPIWIVIISQAELDPFPSLASRLSDFNEHTHHVVNICLLQPQVVLDQFCTMWATSSKYDVFNRLAQLTNNLQFQLLNTAPSVHYCRFGVLCAAQFIVLYLISVDFKLEFMFPFCSRRRAVFGCSWCISAFGSIF